MGFSEMTPPNVRVAWLEWHRAGSSDGGCPQRSSRRVLAAGRHQGCSRVLGGASPRVGVKWSCGARDPSRSDEGAKGAVRRAVGWVWCVVDSLIVSRTYRRVCGFHESRYRYGVGRRCSGFSQVGREVYLCMRVARRSCGEGCV